MRSRLGNNILDAQASGIMGRMPQKQYRDPVKIRALAPLRVPDIQKFRLHPKQFARHQLSNLLLSALICGFGENMVLIMFGLSICAIWLCVELWPWSEWVGVEIANRVAEFSHHWGDYGKSEAESKRLRLYRAVRSISFVCPCWIVGLSLLFGFRHLLEHELARERKEVFSHLAISPARSSGSNTDAGEVTINNNSDEDIHLNKLTCKINALRAGHLTFSGPPSNFYMHFERTTLKRGGDGQSLSCPIDIFFGFPSRQQTLCADIVWKVDYWAEGEPNIIQSKSVRFVMPPGHDQWEQLALDHVPMRCPK